MKNVFASLIEKYPALGYVAAGTSTTTGFWVLIEQLTKLTALASVCVGLCVGLVTWRVQFLQKRKLEKDLSS